MTSCIPVSVTQSFKRKQKASQIVRIQRHESTSTANARLVGLRQIKNALNISVGNRPHRPYPRRNGLGLHWTNLPVGRATTVSRWAIEIGTQPYRTSKSTWRQTAKRRIHYDGKTVVRIC